MREPANIVVLITGADAASVPKELAGVAGDGVDLWFAPDEAELRRALPEADVVLAWDNGSPSLVDAWPLATRVRWIQGVGAGIDKLLFPGLLESDVVLTNAHGMFDRTIAEYALGVILYFAKELAATVELQRRHEWRYRPLARVAGTRLVVVGAGPIGRAIALMARSMAMDVTVVGRSARDDDEFGRIEASEHLPSLLGNADYVIAALPLAPGTRGLIGARAFAAMRPGAVFLNLGRGPVVDEAALIDALRDGRLSGAGLDVFEREPLPPDSPLWDMPNVLVSSHVAGDYPGFEDDIVRLFVENLRRYRAGQALLNVVDKRLGYVVDHPLADQLERR